MRIIQVINSLTSGGAEKLMVDTLPLYNASGCQVDILVLWDNDSVFCKQLKKMNCCKMYVLKKSTNYKHIYLPTHILKIAKIIKNYDLVHVHLFPAQYYTVFANMLIGNKCKLVMTEHNVTNNRINVRAFKPIERYTYNKYARIVCISQEIKNIYANYLNHLVNRLVVIKNGVALHTIQVATPYPKKAIAAGIHQNDKLLLQVSAFRKQKDQPTLIKALRHLPEQVKLLLVGEGVYMNDCEELVNKLHLQHRVFFLGVRMDIPKLLKSVDVVILSSYNEGMSLSSIEGMASGKPFVASDVPGLSGIVSGAGVLFERGDDRELAAATKKLLSDQAHYDGVVAACLKRAANYDIQVMIDNTLALYTEIMKPSKI